MQTDTPIGTRIVGWDAAWTPQGSGAWTLIEKKEQKWRVKLLEATPKSAGATLTRLEDLLGEWRPQVIAVDMPMAVKPVRGYREADRETTRAFSRYGCPVHSPTPERPGEWGDELIKVMKKHGFTLAVKSPAVAETFMEVYPHTALLKMVRSGYRLPYKIQRAGGYYPDMAPDQRRAKVDQTVGNILKAIRMWCEVPEDFFNLKNTAPLKAWKAREDGLDALVCAYAGLGALKGTFLPYGDRDSAIWNPDLKELDPPERML